MNGFGGYGRARKKAKSKAPHVKPTCGPPKFVSGSFVRATRESNGYTKGSASDGSTTYTKGGKQYTVYDKARSTRATAAQVKVGGKVVAKIRLN